MSHVKFPSIESFRHVVKFVRNRCDHHGWSYPTFTFWGDVKLHGTNAGVRLKSNGQLIAQSRERDITVGDDNAGFAAFVSRNEEALRAYMAQNAFAVIFGEWIGPGVQKGVAINQLPTRQFVVFAGVVENDPRLRKFSGEFDVFCEGNPEFHDVVNLKQESITVDFNKPDEVVAELERLTSLYENECPYGKAFGISGIGEGLVWKPVNLGFDVRWNDPEVLNNLMFKTKGLKHGNKSADSKVKVAVSAERIADFNALIEKLLPAWRLEQGLSWMRENGIQASKNNTGEYLKWVAKDVLKEESDYIAASGFEAKIVMAEISKKARQFYFNNTEE